MDVRACEKIFPVYLLYMKIFPYVDKRFGILILTLNKPHMVNSFDFLIFNRDMNILSHNFLGFSNYLNFSKFSEISNFQNVYQKSHVSKVKQKQVRFICFES